MWNRCYFVMKYSIETIEKKKVRGCLKPPTPVVNTVDINLSEKAQTNSSSDSSSDSDFMLME